QTHDASMGRKEQMAVESKSMTATGSPATTKWVYRFEEGDASMRTLLGGKGAGCAEMTNAGLPVPPGFTITTEACNAFTAARGEFPPGMWEQVLVNLKVIEEKAGKKLGDPN